MTTTNTKDFTGICQARSVNNVEIIGDMLFWSFRGVQSTRQEVIDALNIERFNPRIAGRMSEGDAYTRALRQLKHEGFVVKKVNNTPQVKTFQVTAEMVTNNRVVYSPEVIYSFDKETSEISIAQYMGADTASAQASLEDLRIRTAECRVEITTQDLNRIIGRLFNSEADVVKVSDSRAVYFIPSGAHDVALRVKSLLARLRGDKLSMQIIPQMVSTDTIELVDDSVKAEILSEIENIETEIRNLDDVKRDSFWDNRSSKIEELRDRAIAYAALLRGNSSAIEMALDDLANELSYASMTIPGTVVDESSEVEVTEAEESSEVEEVAVVIPEVIETSEDFSDIW